MCFSPEASFPGGVLISSVGIAALREVHKPAQNAFAGIPLLFGIQQITEGFLWMALQHPEYGHVQTTSTYLYLTMARVLWPTMIPLAVLLMEEHGKRKRILSILLGMGSTVSMYYAYCLLFLDVAPQITGHHIRYISDFPESLAVPVFFIYFAATIAPFFISSLQQTRIVGALMFMSCVVTAIFYFQYLTSVWCFFAAIMSGIILWILKDSKKKLHSE